jgi:hypothetical protein
MVRSSGGVVRASASTATDFNRRYIMDARKPYIAPALEPRGRVEQKTENQSSITPLPEPVALKYYLRSEL